ncbi:MAG: chemotaxis protein CheR [Archangium gephyra]|uniref:Chemotaxis protein CheR n=1 Tax=Archangium gephyra TaxID=48 RepID=A0A2W5USQ0_9BACT|nr:MAG: chemotaxis protein CheR [Archangium gephyra]
MNSRVEPLLRLVAARTGTALSRQQRARLEKELVPRVGDDERQVSQLLAHLESREGAFELAQLLALVSVHKTDLFRDEAQLEALSASVLRPLVVEGRALALWSAGCSTGEEVATLLMLLSEAGAHPESTVLGSDLSASALTEAKHQTFTAPVLRRVPPQLLNRYFGAADADGRRTLVARLKSRARFVQHNLMDAPYPFAEGTSQFDVIVCRNVLIYFTAEAAKQTVERFVERLRPGGVLVLSAAEPLLEPVSGLSTLRVPGAFFYVKATPQPAPPPTLSKPVKPNPTPRVTVTGEVPVLLSPEDEGLKLFNLVLDWAAEGADHPETEGGLRKALYLAPRLAAARYLLGLLLERRGAHADASSEYRRALSLLESGTAMPCPFYLNNDRLLAACRLKIPSHGAHRRG